MDFRANLQKQQQEYLDLADHHMATDLTDSDRNALKKAGNKLKTHAYVGTLVGAGLGFALATRGRMRVHNAFLAFQKQAKPVEMVLQDGKHVPVPDIQFREPGPVAVFASTFFLTTIGLLFGSQIGLLTGSLSASSTVKAEADQGRLMNAYRRFRIDVLKKELAQLEGETKGSVAGAVEDLKGFWH